jgi:putative tricarboxylic transport membrane protein
MITRKDIPVGIGLLLIALLVLWHIQSFPPAPGQPYNAALFPGIAAVGLALSALVLIVLGLRANPTAPIAPATDEAGVPVADVPSRMLAIALTAGSIVFYLFAADALGFIVCGTLILAALMWAYGVRPALVVPVAIIVTLLIHFAFYKLLRVPLPWGVLQPFAW